MGYDVDNYETTTFSTNPAIRVLYVSFHTDEIQIYWTATMPFPFVTYDVLLHNQTVDLSWIIPISKNQLMSYVADF